MSRPRNTVPRLCHDRSRNSAFCKVRGRFIRLGEWGSAEAQAAYGQLLTDLAQGRDIERAAKPSKSPQAGFTVNDLLLRFVSDRLPQYLARDGKPSKEQDCFKSVIRIMREHYGESPVETFGPLALRNCRDVMIGNGWCRKFINKQCVRLRHLIRFGVSLEMVPQSVADSLKSVMPIKPGETSAPERPRRRPVEQERIEAAKSRMQSRNRDIIDLLLWTGARPSELIGLRTSDIVTTGAVWEARLEHHKNAHRDQDRILYFGPKAQAVLRRYLDPKRPSERLFPTSVQTLTKSIREACGRAGVAGWTAYQLRHSCATALVDEIGVDAARAILGHATLSQTLHYSATAKRAAVDAAAKLG